MSIPTWLPKDLREAANTACNAIAYAGILINTAKKCEPAKSSNEHLVAALKNLLAAAQEAREAVKGQVALELLAVHKASTRELPKLSGVKGEFAAGLAVAVAYHALDTYSIPYEDKMGHWGSKVITNPKDDKRLTIVRQRVAKLDAPNWRDWEALLSSEAIDAAESRAGVVKDLPSKDMQVGNAMNTNNTARPSKEDEALFSDIARDIKANLDNYREAGQWLNKSFGAAVRERLRQNKQKHGLAHCFNDAIDDTIGRPPDKPGTLQARLTQKKARRLLLIIWLLTDTADLTKTPKLTEFQLLPYEHDDCDVVVRDDDDYDDENKQRTYASLRGYVESREYLFREFLEKNSEYNRLLNAARKAWSVLFGPRNTTAQQPAIPTEQVQQGGGKTGATKVEKPSADVPDENGLVENPIDKMAYLGATQITRQHWPVPPLPKAKEKLKALNKILEEHPEILRTKPASNRLSVHLGRWRDYIETRRKNLAQGLEAVCKNGHWVCGKCHATFPNKPGDMKCPNCGHDKVDPVVLHPQK